MTTIRTAATLVAACAFVSSVASAQMKVNPAPAGSSAPLTVTGQSAAEQAMASVRRISEAEAMRLFKNGSAVIVDVRSNEQFKLGHIKGAVNIPRSQLVARLKELPAGKLIITYCA